jgi:hypothetical protein
MAPERQLSEHVSTAKDADPHLRRPRVEHLHPPPTTMHTLSAVQDLVGEAGEHQHVSQ